LGKTKKKKKTSKFNKKKPPPPPPPHNHYLPTTKTPRRARGLWGFWAGAGFMDGTAQLMSRTLRLFYIPAGNLPQCNPSQPYSTLYVRSLHELFLIRHLSKRTHRTQLFAKRSMVGSGKSSRGGRVDQTTTSASVRSRVAIRNMYICKESPAVCESNSFRRGCEISPPPRPKCDVGAPLGDERLNARELVNPGSRVSAFQPSPAQPSPPNACVYAPHVGAARLPMCVHTYIHIYISTARGCEVHDKLAGAGRPRPPRTNT